MYLGRALRYCILSPCPGENRHSRIFILNGVSYKIVFKFRHLPQSLVVLRIIQIKGSTRKGLASIITDFIIEKSSTAGEFTVRILFYICAAYCYNAIRKTFIISPSSRRDENFTRWVESTFSRQIQNTGGPSTWNRWK